MKGSSNSTTKRRRGRWLSHRDRYNCRNDCSHRSGQWSRGVVAQVSRWLFGVFLGVLRSCCPWGLRVATEEAPGGWWDEEVASAGRLVGRDGIAINERTTIGRWRNSQSQFGFGGIAVVAIPSWYGRSEQRDSGGGGRGRHINEIALPLTRQKQLVWICGSSQIGGVAGGHFGDGFGITTERERGSYRWLDSESEKICSRGVRQDTRQL